MIAKIKDAGATDVIQIGVSWAEADAYMREELVAKDPNGVYVPPFDHVDVWDGAATIIEELEEKPDVLICSVGGGGLFCGLMQGLERKGWNDVKVLTLETRGAASLYSSLQEGELVKLDEITSIATSLGATKVAAKAFEYGQKTNVRSTVLEDKEAVMGCWRLVNDERILVEPACGVNVAMCYDRRLNKLVPELTPETKVVIVLCGGVNVTLEELIRWKEKWLKGMDLTKEKGSSWLQMFYLDIDSSG